jgi:Tol biopolymer transport system component/predicted Ser/Thr protein kinase
MSLGAGERLGPYEILAPLGAGGMGEVYRARDTKLKREVALKVLPDSFARDPERMARFQREAEVLAALNHPNIATIYGVEERALVMELVEGENLKGPLPTETALNYAKQIADALEAAHEKGITHRDLKPANIMITPAGVVKVLDFGLATVSPDPSSGSADRPNSPTLTMRATQAGMLMGTAGYMSPEQARGKAVDKRADIWSFGVVLFEILTGQRLFEGETVSDTLAAVLKEEPDWTRVPAKVRRLLRACLQKDPKQRLQAIGDWKLMLAEDAPIATAPSRSRFRAAGWIAAAVLAIVAVVAHWAPWRKPPAAPDVKRYQIPMKGSFAGAPFLEFAVSPDGRNLAYITRSGGTQLWIQSLDSIEPRALLALDTGSGSPVFPFWSPDSQSVAFVSGAKLRKVNIAGGTPQTICDIARTNITAGSWNRDGVMLVSSGGAILRVSDAGGSPSPVVAPQGAQRSLGQYPFFLPDDRHFLYYGSPAGAIGGSIFIGSLDVKPEAQDAKALFPADSAALFALDPDQTAASGLGHILYRREGALFSRPFDAKRLRLTGEAVTVSDQIGSFTSLPAYSVSANGVLIYHPGLSFRANSQLTWFDRQGHPTGILGDPNSYYNATSISPDGTRVALTIVDYSKSTADLWISDVSRSLPTRLTFGPGYSCCAVWSPDGSRIAFGRRDGKLYRKNADGTGDEEPLPVTGTNPTPTSWSHDGRYLLYTMPNAQGSPDIWVLPLEGNSKPVPFLNTPAEEIYGVFSPDGRWVAYTSNETGARQIYVRPFSSSVRGKWLVSNGASFGAPSWRQDGKELYYMAADSSVMAVPISANQVFQPGEPKVVFKLPSSAVLNAVTPDGNRFLAGVGANATQPSSLPPFTVVLNWQAGLKR